MKKINLNDRVKVKLTPKGAEIYYHQFDELHKKLVASGRTPIEPQMPKIDENGFTDFQLWDLIQLYGEYIGIAKENVFSDIALYFEDKDLEDVTIK